MTSEKKISADKHRWIKIALRTGVAVLTIGIILAWQANWFKSKAEVRQLKEASVPHVDDEILEIRTASLPTSRSLVGTVQPREKVELTARISGRVKQVLVEDGENIQRSEVLVLLDDEIPESQVKQAQAVHAQAKAQLKGSEEMLSRIQESTQINATPEIRLVQAIQAHEAAQESVKRTAGALEEAKIHLMYTRVTSPIEGTVIRTLVDTGDQVMAAQPVAELYSHNDLEIMIQVPTNLAGHIKNAGTLKAYIEPLLVTVDVSLRALVPSADPTSRTLTAHMTFVPPPGVFPGMFVRLEVPGVASPAIAIPISAIETIRQLDFVWVVGEDKKLARRIIRLGKPLKQEKIEVLSGLKNGDKILVSPMKGYLKNKNGEAAIQ